MPGADSACDKGAKTIGAAQSACGSPAARVPVHAATSPIVEQTQVDRPFFSITDFFPLDEYRIGTLRKYEYANLQGQGSSGSTSGELCVLFSPSPTLRETLQGSRDRNSWLVLNGALRRRRNCAWFSNLRYGLSGSCVTRRRTDSDTLQAPLCLRHLAALFSLLWHGKRTCDFSYIVHA